MLSSTSI